MKTATSALLACLIAYAAVLDAARAADKNSGNQKVQTARKQLDQAQDHLKDARETLSKAQKESQQADLTQRSAAEELARVRAAASQRIGAKLGLAAMVNEREAARGEVDSLRKALLDSLERDPDFRSARKQADEAGVEFRSLNENTSLSAETRQRRATELAVNMRRPAELQRERESADRRLQAASSRFRDCDLNVQRLQLQIKNETDADPQVKEAGEKARTLAAQAGKAREALAQAQRQFNTAENAVEREQRDLQQAQNQAKSSTKKKKKN